MIDAKIEQLEKDLDICKNVLRMIAESGRDNDGWCSRVDGEPIPIDELALLTLQHLEQR